MSGFIEGENRYQSALFPERVDQANPVYRPCSRLPGADPFRRGICPRQYRQIQGNALIYKPGYFTIPATCCKNVDAGQYHRRSRG